MNDMLRIELLEKTKDKLSKILLSEASDVYGTPPKYVVIKIGDAIELEYDFEFKTIDIAYLFDGKQLIQVKNDTEATLDTISGMYFNQGSVRLGSAGNKAYLEYIVGPKFGRCFEYEIIEKEDGSHLGNEKIVWVS